MNHANRLILVRLCALFDLLMMIVCFLAAGLMANHHQFSRLSVDEFLSMRFSLVNIIAFLGFLLIWNLTFSFFGLYRSRRLSSWKTDVLNVAQATTAGTAVVWLASLLLNVEFATPLFASIFWTASTASSASSRLALRYVQHRIRMRGGNLRNVLIVGTNKRAIAFAQKIESQPELGYRILGFVDDGWHGSDEFSDSGYEIVVGLNDFPSFLREHVVDEVVVTLPVRSFYQQASHIVGWCEEQGVVLRFLSDIFNSKLARLRSEQIDDASVVTIYTHSMEGWPVVAKRAIDLAVSAILTILLAPLFVVVSLFIKLTSPGPVFFVQQRVGLNKRRFGLFKFRTMIPGAEQKLAELEHLNEVCGPVFKIKNDPRITPIGRFLRRTSIDELPQLFNVIKGNMSLVGPRPLPVRDYEGFDQDWLRRRFSVRPGITCLWQVNGRSALPFEKWMELDMEYIDQWSLSLDLKILAKTVPAVLRGSGAV